MAEMCCLLFVLCMDMVLGPQWSRWFNAAIVVRAIGNDGIINSEITLEWENEGSTSEEETFSLSAESLSSLNFL